MTGLGSVTPAQLDRCVVRRDRSLFADDVAAHREALRTQVAGKRILVVGGAGTIGSATVRLLAEQRPEALHVIDHSENYLAELVRMIRNSSPGADAVDLRMWPIDFAGPIAKGLLVTEAPYHVVLNFAALKHVRSEKDVYSILQMVDTNLVRQARFKAWIEARGGCARYFGVSTDKAANPVGLMGATKRLMEDVLFSNADTQAMAVTSARFANVAYSNGSLLQSWLRRLELGQPLAAPVETRRYFITEREAGEICLLAALLADCNDIVIPRLDPATELREIDGLAVEVLEHFGYRAELFENPRAAFEAIGRLRAERRWPLILTPRDTSGEKPYEEFVGEGETTREIGFKALLAVVHDRSNPLDTEKMIDALRRLVEDDRQATSKADIVAAISSAFPHFHHVETGRSLDQRV